MDDYVVEGKEVPYSELCRCWRENTQAHTYGDTPALYRLLQTIRITNQKQPPQHRLRVLLIDPPIDWSKISTRQDLQPQDLNRESHMAAILEREVYAKGRKALFFAGGAHLGKEPVSGGPGKQAPRPITLPFPGPPGTKTLSPNRLETLKRDASRAKGQAVGALMSPLATLEQRHPGTTLNILLHEGFRERNRELEARMENWPKPGLAHIRGTWYGHERPAPSGDIMIGPDGKRVVASSNATIQDRWDAVLFLGKRHELTRADRADNAVFGKAFLAELERRRRIMGGPPRVVETPDSAGKQFFPGDDR